MISNARLPIGTGTPRARSSRRARSISHSSNSYTSRPPCARTHRPCSGYLTFHQNLAARKPLGPVPSLATTVGAPCAEVRDRFPGKTTQFLRNIQDCFKELLRVARIECRPGMAYRVDILHLAGFASSEPGDSSHQKELRVHQADGGANEQSCTE